MKNIIVREYLESLTERNELDYLFPILLEVMEYKIISTPKQTKGLPQYGKDVVAVGKDPVDDTVKRFYFEVKGGQDRHVTTTTYNKNDGIRESLIEAKDRPFKDSSNPAFNSLPVKIVLVHNGEIHPSVKETFDGFIEREFPDKSFERWDIFHLTKLFTRYLFNEYLLTDDESVKYFKKVLVLINTPRNDFSDFYRLINTICLKVAAASDLGERKKLLFFETLNLISFIVYSSSKEVNNLEPAKHCLAFSCVKLWSWVLTNELDKDVRVVEMYKKHISIFINMLEDYFAKTLPVARLANGLWSERGGRYEQIGYPIRTSEYLSYLMTYFALSADFRESEVSESEQARILADILKNNRSASRPLLDNHSIAICMVLCFLLKTKHHEGARTYLRDLIESIKVAYHIGKRIPDGRNNLESVIRLIVTGRKSIYYEDSTSHLFGMIAEFLAVLDMETEYSSFREFMVVANVHVATFVPYSDAQLKEVFPEKNVLHELALFNHQIQEEGYQSEIQLESDFSRFQKKTLERNEFFYNYRTIEAGFPSVLLLAHTVFKTPLFTMYWRPMERKHTFGN